MIISQQPSTVTALEYLAVVIVVVVVVVVDVDVVAEPKRWL